MFRQPPLVEVVIDLRWMAGPSTIQAASASPAVIIGGAEDTYFEMLQAGLARHGFTRSERLVPLGVPLQSQQVAYRWKQERPFSTVVSAGSGLLAVSARPPYAGWHWFANAVRWLPDLLRESLPEAEQVRGLSRVSLGYINAFDDRLRQGKTPTEFIRDVLGFNAALPPAYAHLGTGSNVDAFSLSTELSTDQGMVVSTSVAQAMHAGSPAAFLALGARTPDGEVVPHGDVLPRLDELHERLDDLFRQMTVAVQELMEPFESNEVEDA